MEETSMALYTWAISEFEIDVGGDVIGEGTFGRVFVGEWQGTKVAVKRLLNTHPAVCSLHT